MTENARRRSTILAKLAMTVVVAGALLAGLLLPWVGGTGMVARNSASLLETLPEELTEATPAGNTRVLAADGSLITNFYTNNRSPVPSDQIADVMKQALVDIEDSRFYAHNGLDVQGTMRALATNLAAGAVREGGSTLTQQLVKQTLLQSADTAEERRAATEQNVGRKLREARLALRLEEEYSKDEILTRYLNLVYFGQGAYGVQAAAQRYFSVNAADLSLPQAAMLAGLAQSPANDDPILNPENAQVRRNQVLQRMHVLGHITDQELADISATPVEVAPQPPAQNGCIDASTGGFFCAYVREYLIGTLGLTEGELANGGLTVQTTLRPDVQAAGDQAVLNTLPMGDSLAGMYTVVEPGTGHVLAMSVNREYGCSDPAVCESVVLNVRASQGSGSTYKVFTAAAALERGFSQYYTISTGNRYTSRVYKNGSRPYSVPNAGSGYPGTSDMEQALVMSSNTYFLALEDALGSVEGPVRMAERMGMRFDQPNQTPADQIIDENRGSFTFGAEPTSPLDLANAYSTLAANGTRCDPTPVTAVLDRDGEPLQKDGRPLVADNSCTPGSIPQGVATTLNQILRKDVEPGTPGQTGARAYVPGHQIAGKTGTTQSRYSVAFVGYTPEYAASVMVLDPKEGRDVGSFGGGKGATIWHDAMAPILGGRPMVPFAAADPVVQNGNTRVVPDCRALDECRRALQAAGLRSAVTEAGADQPRGTVLGLSPAAGSRVSAGQVVTIQVSGGGSDPAAPDGGTGAGAGAGGDGDASGDRRNGGGGNGDRNGGGGGDRRNGND
ncbi:penicillin-binding protein [Geodermatophilus sp. YIM 151500]|uniref:penicillin-binding protein n=1 Tax=Geodermatophilus sp. YIM 151500 TaxID=2984531 RepID=UPI0021E4FBCD|nr:transglycosylase domain-containing protein [Geodermatophilus sp. YIM 151500]MCV2491046.1 penicillin-binding protein [Geodermatophilus sp. YIM 151500]